MHAHALKRARVFPTSLPDADSTLAEVTTAVESAAVIELRLHRGARQDPPLDGADPDSREGQLARIVQSLYMDRGRTLTDPRTAEAHTIALDLALLILDGAHATGQLAGDAHIELRAMMSAAQDVPALL